jgi:hypothetical protein
MRPSSGGGGGHFDCGDHRPGLSAILARDAERRAVVGRGAHDRQSKRNVDTVVEIEGLEWDQCLIMVTA